MDLCDSPTEILSRVCRHIGLHEAHYRNDIYLNRDLKSLRLVCKELYIKTTCDAGIRYRWNLQTLRIPLTRKSLALFFHLCKIPAFRDKIEVILLRHPGFKCGRDDIGMYVSPGGEYKAHLHNEDMDAFINSSEAVYLLAACFREINKSSPVLQKIEILNEEANPLVFSALELVQVNSKLVIVPIHPHHLRSDSDARLLRPVSASSRLINAVTFAIEEHVDENDSGMKNF
jgi:hypothetical protein